MLGQDFRLHLGDAELAGHCVRRRSIVAGQHDDLDALSIESGERIGGRRLYGIGNRENPGRPSVDRHQDCGCAVAAQLIGFLLEGRRVGPGLAEEGSIPDHNPAALDFADHALARGAVELACILKLQPAFHGRFDDRRSQRMFAPPFEAGG